LIGVALLCGFIGLQFLFASLLSSQDFRRPRGPDGNEKSLGPGVTDGFETLVTQPALSLCQRMLSAPTRQSRGVLQPVDDLFRCASESDSSSRLVLVLVAVNTVIWAIGVAALCGVARLLRALEARDIKMLRQLPIRYAVPVLPGVALVFVARSFQATSDVSACLHSLLSSLVLGSLWLGMFLLLRVLAKRHRGSISKLGLPAKLAVFALWLFFLLLWQYLTISHVPLSRAWTSDTLPYGQQFSALPLRGPVSWVIGVASPVGLFPLGTILRSGELRPGDTWQKQLAASLFRPSWGIQATFAVFVAINSAFWLFALVLIYFGLRRRTSHGRV
jgi:hypothetical protein